MSPRCGLLQAFGMPAFSLHPLAMLQCMFSSSSKIWLVTVLCPGGHSRLMQRGGLGARSTMSTQSTSGCGAGCHCGYNPGWVTYQHDQPCKGS